MFFCLSLTKWDVFSLSLFSSYELSKSVLLYGIVVVLLAVDTGCPHT